MVDPRADAVDADPVRDGPAGEPALAWLGSAAAAVRPVAVIWATVELERALADLGHPAREIAAAVGAAVDDPHLGARVVIVADAPGGGLIALAEPSTEGRLAAVLARHGEGPAGHYLRAPDAPDAPDALDAIRTRAAAANVAVSRPAVGPFGPSLLIGGPVAGPHVILVEPAGGTIAAMTDHPPTSLRAATPDDAERIAALFTDEGYPSGPSDIVERLARFDSEYSRVIVAENGGTILGFVAVHALPRFEHSDRIVRIMALVVDAGERGRGIGRLLMEEAERLGREVGAAFAEVTAGHHRPDARRLYEELGYDGTVAAYLRKRL